MLTKQFLSKRKFLSRNHSLDHIAQNMDQVDWRKKAAIFYGHHSKINIIRKLSVLTIIQNVWDQEHSFKYKVNGVQTSRSVSYFNVSEWPFLAWYKQTKGHPCMHASRDLDWLTKLSLNRSV